MREQAIIRDRNDTLRNYRDLFDLEESTIYLDGNSLGPPLRAAKSQIQETIEHHWSKRLIRSWNEDWLDAQKRTAEKLAKLINAEPDEVIIADSVSVNLYKLAFAALASNKEMKEVITDSLNFPSDLYILHGLQQQSFKEKSLRIIEQESCRYANDRILEAISDKLNLLSLSHVTYKSAFKYDVKSINKKVKQCGGLNLWDLSHSIGAVSIDVKDLGVDMAVGCTYKYLNAGPGAPAFLYLSKAIQEKLRNPIKGWFSHKNPFEFDRMFEPITGAQAFAVGTPSIISLKGIEPNLDVFLEAGMQTLERKSKDLFDYFILNFQNILKERNFTMDTPMDSSERGSHIALLHEEAYRINLSLINPRIPRKSFITDHRPPNIIRIALTPLYMRFEDIWHLTERLAEIIDTKEYELYSDIKTGVI